MTPIKGSDGILGVLQQTFYWLGFGAITSLFVAAILTRVSKSRRARGEPRLGPRRVTYYRID